MGVAPAQAPGPQRQRLAELARARDFRQRLDSGVIAPLLHAEEALGRERGELGGAGRIDRQRLFAEHGHTELERGPVDRGMGVLGRGDDDAIDT